MPGRGLRVTSLGYISLLHEKFSFQVRVHAQGDKTNPVFELKSIPNFNKTL